MGWRHERQGQAMSNATAAQQRHWTRVAALGCLVCHGPAEIAHAHGGSVRERLREPKARGKKLRRLNWLVLPLCDKHHRLGPPGFALDLDVPAWERIHGPQAGYIDELCRKFDLDLWTLAKQGAK